MPKLWLPDADRWNTRDVYFAPMGVQGKTRKMVWHKTEGDSLYGAAEWMRIKGGTYYHLVLDLQTGGMIQFTGADRAARSLENGGFHHGLGCNKFGEICLQVAVVGWSKDGLIPEGSRRRNLDKVLEWADSWGVPRVMPHGNLGTRDRSYSAWEQMSGHFSHAQAPGNRHHDPGWCSPKHLFGEDREMPEYAEFGRKAFTIPAGKAVWVNWTDSTREGAEIHDKGESVLKVPGLYEATVELRKSPGDVEVAFCETQDREVLSVDPERVSQSVALISNKGRVGPNRNLKIRMKNMSEKPVRVFSTELRLVWWK